MSRELDAECDRALGHIVDMAGETIQRGSNDGPRRVYLNDDKSDYIACPPVPAYSTDPTAARLLEDEIERRGLFNHYTFALGRQVGIADDAWQSRDTLIAITWLLLRATPEQRARAFLEAVK